MKFFGKIGYARSEEDTSEDRLGIWEDTVEEHDYFGDVLSNSRRYETQSDSVLDNVAVSNKISVVADAFAYAHLGEIKYVVWMGQKWKVKEIEVQRPRLILQIGGVYNGPTR